MFDLPNAYAAPVRTRRRGPPTRLAAALARHAENKARQRCIDKFAEYDDRLLDDIELTCKQATGQHSWPAWVVVNPRGR